MEFSLYLKLFLEQEFEDFVWFIPYFIFGCFSFLSLRFAKNIENLSEDILGYQSVFGVQNRLQTAVKRGDPVFTQHRMAILQHLTPTALVWVEDLITLPMWVPVLPLPTANTTKQVLRHSTVTFPEDQSSSWHSVIVLTLNFCIDFFLIIDLLIMSFAFVWWRLPCIPASSL